MTQEIKAVLDKPEQDLRHIYNELNGQERGPNHPHPLKIKSAINGTMLSPSIGEKIDPERYIYSAAYIFKLDEHVANGRISAETAADVRYFEQHHRSRDLIYNTSSEDPFSNRPKDIAFSVGGRSMREFMSEEQSGTTLRAADRQAAYLRAQNQSAGGLGRGRGIWMMDSSEPGTCLIQFGQAGHIRNVWVAHHMRNSSGSGF